LTLSGWGAGLMVYIRNLIRRRAGLLKQFVKFGLVGVSNTLLSLAIYYLLVMLGVNFILANGIAFVLSVLNSYYWNNRFVFSKSTKGHLKPLIRTYLCYGSTFLLSTGLLYLMVAQLGISKLIAPLLNLIITIPLNFLINKYWAFK
jgi:putative flippase GtrA